jgi:hypothetical protein
VMFLNDGDRHLHLQPEEGDHLHLCTKESAEASERSFRWVPGSSLTPQDGNDIWLWAWFCWLYIVAKLLLIWLWAFSSPPSILAKKKFIFHVEWVSSR